MSHVLISFKIAIKSIVVVFAKLWAVPAIILLGTAGYNTDALTHKTPPVAVVKQITPDYSLDITHLENRLKSLEKPNENTNLGGTNSLPTSVAIFSTSLQSAITSSQSTMTLNSATYNNGVSTIASSTYDFIIDEGTTVQEFVSADCTGVTCTNMTRGLSWLNGTTTVSTLQFSHRRGASVKITDAPIVLKLNWLALGGMGYPGPIKYASISTTSIASSRDNLASWGLVQDTAFNGAGAIKATTAAAGYVQLATSLQQASSTSTSGGNPLVIQSGNATSSCASAATAALSVLVADNSGRLNSNCVPSTFTATTTFAAGASFSTSTATTTNIGAFPAYWIGKNTLVFTATGANTFIVPSGINKVNVRMCGAGGGGTDATGGTGGGAGGAGAYAEGNIDLTGTTSVQVFIGSGGLTASNGSASTFSTYMTAGGGFGAGATAGGNGGTASGGYLNVPGGLGLGGTSNTTGSSGIPGASYFGGQGAYCAGSRGGTASNGVAIVTW